MEVPDIQFAKSGDVDIGYQRWGTGPDVVVIPPLVSNIEIMWENELWRRALEFNGPHIRSLQFDKRGIGISDRFEQHPTLEQRIGDINAVMDAEGIERASLMGLSEGGLMAQLFAAIHPERVDRLVLINSLPGPSAWTKVMQLVETWGRDPAFLVEWFMPSQRENASLLRWDRALSETEREPGGLSSPGRERCLPRRNRPPVKHQGADARDPGRRRSRRPGSGEPVPGRQDPAGRLRRDRGGRPLLLDHALEDVARQVVLFCQAESITGQTQVIDAGIVFH
jgi:pimeloyl-ACP methyl ester carboxylesterase